MTITPPSFNWTSPASLSLLVLALMLLAVQCGLLFKQHRRAGRFAIRLALNLLLWVSVVAWIVDPAVLPRTRISKGLLVADHVPPDVAAHWKDSLNAERVDAKSLADNSPDTLVIGGQGFDDGFFSALSQLARMPHLQWIPFFKTGEIQDLNAKGVLRKGEMQQIDGVVAVARKQMLQVRFGDQALDSTWLTPGVARFRLAFPAFSEGRTEVTLHLSSKAIDTLRYFTLPGEKVTVHFMLDSPDFETRNLAAWLGKQGHPVSYDAVLSKNIQSRTNINNAGEPDLIVTIPERAEDAAVKKAVSGGKGVLFLGLGDVAADIKHINSALGTRFQATKFSNEESVAIAPSLSALPFRWNVQDFQLKAPHYPVLSERIAGNVTVSLLNESFPVQLSGDSTAYARLWNELLAWSRPASGPVVAWNAPVFQGVPVHLHWNNFKPLPAQAVVGTDTVTVSKGALTSLSTSATFVPHNSGWLSLHDSLGTELFAETASGLARAAQMQRFVRTSSPSVGRALAPEPERRPLPAWGWFAWIMACMTALWIERKI